MVTSASTLPANSLPDGAAPQSEFSSTLRIIATAILSFACYITIGMQLAVVPSFVHLTLHFSAVIAGLAVSVQYVATLASRPFAGHTSDTKGAKRATASGLCSIIASGALFTIAAFLRHDALASLLALCLSRLVLGFGESWVATGGALWGIARMGESQQAKVISWNGVGSYGGMAVGAPVGVLLENHYGLGTVGLVSIAISAAAAVWAATIPRVATYRKPPLAFAKVLKKVTGEGIGLGLGGIGFGTIAAFITLFYASRNWPDASLSLTLFGAAFVVARLGFAWTVTKWGGYPVAMVSLAVECAGLLVLWLAPAAAGRANRRDHRRFRIFAGLSGAGRRGGPKSSGGKPRVGAGDLHRVHRFIDGRRRAPGRSDRQRGGLPADFPIRRAAAVLGIALLLKIRQPSATLQTSA